MDPHPEITKESLPRGLVLFSKDCPPLKRRRRLLFLALFFIILSTVLWPIYPLFAGIEPRILGLPFSFAWITFSLGSMFGLLLWTFRTEDHDPATTNSRPQNTEV